MIDIHSHILYGVDDGSSDEEETKKMLNIAVDEGISCIIASPHYIVANNNYDRQDLQKRYEEVKKYITSQKIPLEIRLGNELFVDCMLAEKLKEGECFTLADSDYVLLEFSHMSKRMSIEHVIYELQIKGYRVIIAHPERTFDISDIDFLIELIENGSYLQSNTGSLTGLYGKEVQKMVDQLLERNMISFFSTDAHTSKRRAPRIREAYDIVNSRCGDKYAEDLFHENAKKILLNEYIECAKVKKISTSNFVEKIKYIFKR